MEWDSSRTGTSDIFTRVRAEEEVGLCRLQRSPNHDNLALIHILNSTHTVGERSERGR
jgi:hypothetical protein